MCDSHLSNPNPVCWHDESDAGYSRRSILQAGLAMISTAATVPALLGLSGEALADQQRAAAARGVRSMAGVPEDRVLVVVQLSGGNDGLNAVVPYGLDNGGYYKARPRLAVPEKDLVRLNGMAEGLGLHPSLAPLRDMLDDGTAAIHLGVGYPQPNRSHFVSMDIWQTADPETQGREGRGWLGRAMDPRSDELDSVAMISIGNEAPLATRGKRTDAVAFQDARLFRWAAGDANEALESAYDGMHRGPGPAPNAVREDPAAFLYQTALNARVASDRVRRSMWRKTETSMPGGQLGDQLKMVSKMIAAELPTRVYYVTLGGFDTHADQGWRHEGLLRQFANSIAGFYRELRATGHDSRVVTFAFSEFGRRVRQNASGGTDHGTAGPCFAFGPAVRPGIHGRYPSLTDLDNGDLKFTQDFRGLYAGLLGNWLALDPADALVGYTGPAAGVVRA